jgi:hypothetical protein
MAVDATGFAPAPRRRASRCARPTPDEQFGDDRRLRAEVRARRDPADEGERDEQPERQRARRVQQPDALGGPVVSEDEPR